jgi:ribA/ribD-fused uncharacterized protein
MAINSFSGKYHFLSNFYPVKISLDEVVYPTVEHAYQAAKTFSEDQRAAILKSETPGIAKRLGRLVTLRNDWEDVKFLLMKELVTQKFCYPELEDLLKSTYPHELIEGNTWGDTYWGVCNGVGHSHLGNILTEIRFRLMFT